MRALEDISVFSESVKDQEQLPTLYARKLLFAKRPLQRDGFRPKATRPGRNAVWKLPGFSILSCFHFGTERSARPPLPITASRRFVPS